MLKKRNHIAAFLHVFPLALLLLCGAWARAQGAVYVLKAGAVEERRGVAAEGESTAQPFELHRNLIFFPASIDGRLGDFILDTGAPTLLLNDPAASLNTAPVEGYGAGGQLSLEQRRVNSLSFAGRDHGRTWALALDLTAMEARTGRAIAGFVGYEQLWNKELRIDYAGRQFSIRPSVRRPLHEGRAPDHVLDLDFDDHLPVVTLRFGKRRLRFIVDTGAGTNLLDSEAAVPVDHTGRQMNIQGLDGAADNYDLAVLPVPDQFELLPAQRRFVSMPLAHLQEADERPVAGILGSPFLNAYTVGIDYRRGKLYLWKPSTNNPDLAQNGH